MFSSVAKRLRAVIVLAIATALTVGGVALAQESGAGGKGRATHGSAPPSLAPGHPPIGLLPLRGLTYAELHVEHNGEAEVIRVDKGKVASVSESSITLSENDGSEVTIPIGKETKVLGKPGKNVSLEELKGKLVLVTAPSGGSAKSVLIEPKLHGGASARHMGASGKGSLRPARPVAGLPPARPGNAASAGKRR